MDDEPSSDVLVGLLLSEPVGRSLQFVAKDWTNHELHTGAVLAAVAQHDALGNWDRLWLHTGTAEDIGLYRAIDSGPGILHHRVIAGIEHTLSNSLVLAFGLLRRMVEAYDMAVVQPGAIATALLAAPGSGAAECLLAQSELDQAGLLALVQTELLGVRLSGVDTLIANHNATADVTTEPIGSESGSGLASLSQVENIGHESLVSDGTANKGTVEGEEGTAGCGSDERIESLRATLRSIGKLSKDSGLDARTEELILYKELARELDLRDQARKQLTLTKRFLSRFPSRRILGRRKNRAEGPVSPERVRGGYGQRLGSTPAAVVAGMVPLQLDHQLPPTVRLALLHLRIHQPKVTIHTAALLHALMQVDSRPAWRQLSVRTGFNRLNQFGALLDSDNGGTHEWEGLTISDCLARCLKRADRECILWDCDELNPGLVALNMFLEEESGVARASREQAKMMGSELVQMIMTEFLGSEPGDSYIRGTPERASAKESPRRRVFISYSRRDYQSARALYAGVNETEGITSWMDLADVMPGMDWTSEIDAALASVDALVLIASPASMSSQYVAYEWRRALQRGIPVVLAIVSRCRIPQELIGAAVVDLRSQFDKRSRTLARYLSGDGQLSRLVSESQFARFKPRVPTPSLIAQYALTLIHLAFLLLALACTLGSLVTAGNQAMNGRVPLLGSFYLDFSGLPSGCSVVMLLASALLVQGRCLILLVRHRIDPTFWAIFQLGTFLALAIFALLLGSWDRQESPVAWVAWAQLVSPHAHHLVAAVAVTTTISAFIALNSKALFRYARPDYGRDSHARLGLGPTNRKLREALQRVAPSPSFDVPLTYQVIPLSWQNVYVAVALGRVFQLIGMTEYEDGFWKVYIISNASLESAEQMMRKSEEGRAVCVLTTPVRLPVDSRILRRNQWLDFRKQDIRSLETLVGTLTGRPVDTSKNPARPPVDPERFVIPGRVLWASIEAFAEIAIALAVLVATVFKSGHSPDVIAVQVFLVLFGFWRLRQLIKLVRRTYRAGRYGIDSIVTCVMYLLGLILVLRASHPSGIWMAAYWATLVALIFRRLFTGADIARSWLLLNDEYYREVTPIRGVSLPFEYVGAAALFAAFALCTCIVVEQAGV